MTAPADCQLVGRWRIVEADPWDRDYLDLVEPAALTIGADGRGDISFGAMQASLDLEYGRSTVFFTWAGFDEMDEVSGSGSAELLDDGSLEIEFAYHLGDEAVLKAERAGSAEACRRALTERTLVGDARTHSGQPSVRQAPALEPAREGSAGSPRSTGVDRGRTGDRRSQRRRRV